MEKGDLDQVSPVCLFPVPPTLYLLLKMGPPTSPCGPLATDSVQRITTLVVLIESPCLKVPFENRAFPACLIHHLLRLPALLSVRFSLGR